jgi:hypothetical protein
MIRTIEGVRIDHAIVHVVKHAERPVPMLSGVELELGKEPQLREYFANEVEYALSASAAGGAHFLEESQAAIHCRNILANRGELVAASQRLAELLVGAIGSDQRISPGRIANLAICLFSAEKPADRTFLALIKIDPSPMLRQRIRRQVGKEVSVSFEVVPDVMPTDRDKLQKAALVGEGATELELLLLDRQTPKVAANYFAQTFLQAELLLDPRERTSRLHIGLLNAHNQLTAPAGPGEPHLTPDQSEVFRRSVEVALRGKRINLDTWVPNLPLPPQAKAVINRALEARIGPDRRFALDPAFAERLVRKIRLRGDYEVLIEMEAQHEKDVIKNVTELPGGKTRLVLEVPHLRWVK